jgi:hypothetical protein
VVTVHSTVTTGKASDEGVHRSKQACKRELTVRATGTPAAIREASKREQCEHLGSSGARTPTEQAFLVSLHVQAYAPCVTLALMVQQAPQWPDLKPLFHRLAPPLLEQVQYVLRHK